MWLQRFKKLKRNIEKTRQKKAKLFKKVQSFFKSPKELRPAKLTNKTGFDIILETCASTKRNIQIARTTDLMYNLQLINVKPKKKKEYQYIFKEGSTVKSKTYNFEEALVRNGIIKWIFGDCQFGEFTVTEAIVDYVAQARRDERVTEKGLPPLEKTYFDKAKKIFEILKEETKIEENLCYSMIGAFWCEIGWAFDQPIYNKEECAGKGQPDTIGPENCGECWFGLTFWSTKEGVIKGINAPVPTDKLQYGGSHTEKTYKGGDTGTEQIPTPDTTKMLCGLDQEWQVKIVNYYVEKLCGKHGKNLIGKGDEDEEAKLCSSFLFKAGGKDPTLEEVDKRANDYIKRHEKDYGGKAKNGFATQMYVAMLFALYMENDEIPELEELDEMIGV